MPASIAMAGKAQRVEHGARSARGQPEALKASVCGKISAQASPCAMWWRVPSG